VRFVSAPGGIRHVQLPVARPGMFMRASLPRPSTSCAWTIARRAGEEYARRISDHHGWRSRTPARSICDLAAARTSSGSDSHQPRSVSLSCVLV